jgi:uncharacterized Zn finger protein
VPREDARTRARRFLAEGRVMIVRAGPSGTLGVVRGDSGALRRVTWTPGRGWRCDCPAMQQCAHGFAVASVVLTEQSPGGWVDLGELLTRGNGGTHFDREARMAGMIRDPQPKGAT